MTGYIIENGTVYVPGSGKFEKRDVFIINGKIQNKIESKEKLLAEDNIRVIDAEGCYVTKGLIDYHVHYFQGGADNGVNSDVASFPNGVTTAVDGGTSGVSSFEIFRQAVIGRADVRLLAQLLVGSGGQLTERYPEHIEKEMIDEDRITEMFEKHKDCLVGLKMRLSANVIEEREARGALEKSVEIAEKLGCNLTVHITNPAMNLEEMAGILRKGDVVCHMFQNKGKENILDSNQKVRKGIWRARERGVLFDACNGRNNFDLKIAEAALKENFFPDIISSDINTCSYYEGVLHSLPKVLSKYIAFGCSLDKILDAAIYYPAKVIGREELASMENGSPADLFIFRIVDKDIVYLDHTNGQNKLYGKHIIKPQMTIKDGKIVYSQVDFER